MAKSDEAKKTIKKKYYLAVLTVLLSTIILAVGISSKLTIDDLLSDGGNIIIGVIGLFVLFELKDKVLTIGWLLYFIGLSVDLLDEVFELPVWVDDYLEHAAYGFGLMTIVFAFNLLVKQKQEAADHFEGISKLDDLTGLNNSRRFFEVFEEMKKQSESIVLLFCDLDYFKTVNDTYGHIAGDTALQVAARIITRVVGNKGTVFRYGGEEFAILLRDCSINQACVLAESLRMSVKESKELQQYANSFPLTISIGIASYPDSASNIHDLIAKADLAMYYSKQKGRNQYSVCSPRVVEIVEKGPLQGFKQKLTVNFALSLVCAIDAKDNYTRQHSEQVTAFALQIAEALSLPEEDILRLHIGALMHDCGKIGIPDEVINKPGKLSEGEFNLIKKHARIGHNIIKYITDDYKIISSILHHHERWDGKGYPEGLAGEEISLFARIISVADAYHAMISSRPYRQAFTQFETQEELRKGAGSQFDPALVECFLDILSSEKQDRFKKENAM